MKRQSRNLSLFLFDLLELSQLLQLFILRLIDFRLVGLKWLNGHHLDALVNGLLTHLLILEVTSHVAETGAADVEQENEEYANDEAVQKKCSYLF